MKLWGLEPSVITSAVVALLTLLVSFGIPIAPEQRDAIVGFVTAALVIIGGIVIRQQVTPNAKIEAAFGLAALAEAGAVKKEEIGTIGSMPPPTDPVG